MSLLPIRRQVVVPGDPELAYGIFVDDIGGWWPLGEHSVHGGRATVGIRGDQLVEVGPDGAEAVWGTLEQRDRPYRLRLTWHPGGAPERATEVEVRFAPVAAGQTLVTLEHWGWERLADPAGTRAEYDEGWPEVLAGFVTVAAGQAKPADAVTEPDEVWLALVHTAGPAIDLGGSVFAHPDFGRHVAFLRSLREEGLLVAAGPLDGDGDGMTVVRTASPDEVGELVRRAQDEDGSITHGVLQVRVRPWSVVMTG